MPLKKHKKLHVSTGSGHRQVLSFDSLKIILYNSRECVFDEEISTSKPLLGHGTSIDDGHYRPKHVVF